MEHVIDIDHLDKTYPSGFKALKDISLSIRKGEIFALLGPNGAGKTTLISILCGIVNPGDGQVRIAGMDIRRHYREVRRQVGLVPQELSVGIFETVWDTVRFSRGLFGLPPDPAYLEDLLRKLSLWEKRDNEIMTLSGGMKRRVLIAKALSHQPRILFLDEPTAGVDVELRRDMWMLIRGLRDNGMTVILTTHYIEEAEEMADRVCVINRGEIILVEDTQALMQKLGRKQLMLQLTRRIDSIPDTLAEHPLALSEDGTQLVYTYDTKNEEGQIASLMRRLHDMGIEFRDLHTTQSSLEDIFVGLVEKRA